MSFTILAIIHRFSQKATPEQPACYCLREECEPRSDLICRPVVVDKLTDLADTWATVSRPDSVRFLPDGSREEIRLRKSPGQPGYRSQTRKLIGADGLTREVWPEVIDAAGNMMHQHCKFRRGEEGADAG